MEETIAEWGSTRYLALDVLLPMVPAGNVRRSTPSGIKIDVDFDVDDDGENREYKLVDKDGKEVAFPVRLVSDTTVQTNPQ